MLLTGHAGEVFTCKFNPTGDVIASGSHDKHIFLWRTYGECENYMMMKGGLFAVWIIVERQSSQHAGIFPIDSIWPWANVL